MTNPAASRSLLAVDLGLMTGLALFGADGRLRWYRSQHYANAAALRRAVPRILGNIPDLAVICVEGGGNLYDIWAHEADRRHISINRVAAETWRARLLYAREHRNRAQAKRTATDLAQQIIRWSGARRPTRPGHDVSEAILLGLWAVLDAGWIAEPPAELRG